MTAEQIIKLIDAGYTKADIDKLIITAQADNNTFPNTPEPPADKKDPTPAGSASDVKKPEPKEQAPAEPEPEPKPDPLDDIKKQIGDLTETLTAISKVVINPAMAQIKPVGIDDIISNFFKEE